MLRLLPAMLALLIPLTAHAQPASPDDASRLRAQLDTLQARIAALIDAEEKIDREGLTRSRRAAIADVEIFAKAADWILRHEEFYKPEYVAQTERCLAIGLERAAKFAEGTQPWGLLPGRHVLGYYSQVDGSVQPYAVTIPAEFSPDAPGRAPLHIVLHGRADTMNEVNFISRYEGKSVPAGVEWLQLDVYGRGNNAYRWSGETDVFEALKDLKRRFRIDERRITLRGFSMGGAGAWHLGLHHPATWCSVGPGAGFVDTYAYQKIKAPLPLHQHQALGIYDAVDYALNAASVPVCTYGGEIDPQLAASTTMVEAAKKFDVEIKLLIGPETGHKFHPESEKEFMEFHLDKSREGRPGFPGLKHVRFTTRTLKYNQCDWITIEEMLRQYEPTTIDARIDDENGEIVITTQNVGVLSLSRDVGSSVTIDGDPLPLAFAADNLLPNVYYYRSRSGWAVIGYDATRKFQENPDRMKRPGLQGPIDDAFTSSFVCVRGTGTPLSQAHHDWAMWTLARFEREFDKWLRGKIRIVDDVDVTAEMIEENHLILFGDPGSNSLLAKALKDLPVEWTAQAIQADGASYDPAAHGVSLIYPNPLNPYKYVVVNSGHTFHEAQFKASNAQLYPRLGDFAIQSFVRQDDGSYREETVKAVNFNSGWRFPVVRD